MKKMYFRNIVCEITIDQDFKFYSEVECLYEKDTIAYAVERFLLAVLVLFGSVHVRAFKSELPKEVQDDHTNLHILSQEF
jgi:hypothetical protein